jgi:hypothetical protein
MAPKSKKATKNENAWFENAYQDVENLSVLYEIRVGEDTVTPGSPLKIKNRRGSYKFRCLVHNSKLDVSWVDVICMTNGSWISIRPEQIKCLVKPKRSRRRKTNV